MNFEVIDNCFQILVLWCAALTATGLSMTDKERMDVIDRVYRDVRNQRNLVRYYTNRNIGISYLRAKKKNDTQRVLDLYGTDNQRYW